MSQPQKTRRKKIVLWASVIVLLPVMYLLSLGPWVYAVNNDAVPPRIFYALGWFYSPISSVGNYTDFFEENPIGQVYMEYIGWWANL